MPGGDLGASFRSVIQKSSTSRPGRVMRADFRRARGRVVMHPTTSRLTSLLGTASFLALSTSLSAQAQQVAQGQMAQAQETVPEQVLITGSLIRGTAAVAAPA